MSVEDQTMEETAVISLTEAAAEKLDGIMKEKGVRETHALRVFVSGGGCSGLQYGMTFDPTPRDDRHRRACSTACALSSTRRACATWKARRSTTSTA